MVLPLQVLPCGVLQQFARPAPVLRMAGRRWYAPPEVLRWCSLAAPVAAAWQPAQTSR